MEPHSSSTLLDLLLRETRSDSFSKNEQFKILHVDPMIRLVTHSCRDKNAINDALELVPISEIIQNNQEILDDMENYSENLLPLLTEWFANEFFTWFRVPLCKICSSQMSLLRTSKNEEHKRVEHYRCKNDDCDQKFDFIRHNEPAILLRTRTGRCGEWANCFMTILLAFGYHVRMVFDSSDHVWNEIWSEKQVRWIHVDPCECAIDKPLLYELGWSKKLEYCLAFGQYEVLDVTPRYCLDFNSTKIRRDQVDEGWLAEKLDQISSELLDLVLDKDLRQTIQFRRESDKKFLRAIATKPQTIPNGYKLGGRKTGELSWRIQRGEISSLVQNKCIINVIKSDDTEERSFNLRYNCDKNSYDSTSNHYLVEGWSTLTYDCENVYYKYERDWRTSYISRYESCPHDLTGYITWRFNLSGLFEQHQGLEFDAAPWTEIQILIKGKEYPNANLNLKMHCLDINNQKVATRNLEINVENLITAKSLPIETRILDLKASLSGGCQDDQVAWQKPQLFRQTKGQDSDDWSFVVKVI